MIASFNIYIRKRIRNKDRSAGVDFCILAYINPPILIYINAGFNNFVLLLSFDIIFALGVRRIINLLMISVQRHPDNVTWLEVNGLVVVQSGGSVGDDVAVFVGYEQFAIKTEVFRPICLVVGTAIVGNGERANAHAKYHSRSQCYGKYFFHSLSSS